MATNLLASCVTLGILWGEKEERKDKAHTRDIRVSMEFQHDIPGRHPNRQSATGLASENEAQKRDPVKHVASDKRPKMHRRARETTVTTNSTAADMETDLWVGLGLGEALRKCCRKFSD